MVDCQRCRGLHAALEHAAGWIKAGHALALFATDADSASALGQALFHRRWWFWPVVAALAIALASFLPSLNKRMRGNLLLAGGWLGLVAVAAQGWFIGVHGWSYDALTQVFGELNDRQFGMGWGGCITFACFVVLTTTGLALHGRFGGDRFVAGAVGLLVASILLFTVWPVLTILGQALSTPAGQTTGAVFLERFFQPKIWGIACFHSKASCGAAWNTLVLGIATATACMLLGLAFALVVTRTGFRFKQLLRLLTVLPIITPPFVIGLGLILIFGRSGLINQWAGSLFGVELGRWIYGFNGVWLAQVFSFTPTAFLVLIGVVQGISPTMEEAIADAARQSGAHVCEHHVAADAAGIGQRLARRLHRESGGFRQSRSCSAARWACCRPRFSSPWSAPRPISAVPARLRSSC